MLVPYHTNNFLYIVYNAHIVYTYLHLQMHNYELLIPQACTMKIFQNTHYLCLIYYFPFHTNTSENYALSC